MVVHLVPGPVLEKKVVEGHDVLRVMAVARVVRSPGLVEVFISLQPHQVPEPFNEWVDGDGECFGWCRIFSPVKRFFLSNPLHRHVVGNDAVPALEGGKRNRLANV